MTDKKHTYNGYNIHKIGACYKVLYYGTIYEFDKLRSAKMFIDTVEGVL